ncbi:MAG: hypothetical protein CR980_00255 [Propionibacteriales bacterium]|nr:MAG: hypothetical protein CR980_00255 [Propionibacteriales bacterium]
MPPSDSPLDEAYLNAVPRRSATSPDFPVDPDSDEAKSMPARWFRSSSKSPDPDELKQIEELSPEEAEAKRQKRKKLQLILGAAGAVLLVIVVIIAIVLSSSSSSPATNSASPTGSASSDASAAPLLTKKDLMSEADADLILDDAGWKIAETTNKPAQSKQILTCISASNEPATPTSSFLRVLTSATKTKAGILHRADGFASVAEAEEVYKSRLAQLASCNLVPSYIVKSASVTGLGDGAAIQTVVNEEATGLYHTVLLARTGKVIDVIDAVNLKKVIPAKGVSRAAAKVVNLQCKRSEGACAKSPKVSTSTPLPTADKPWLTASDLPRLTPGFGEWTPTDPLALKSQGTGCENVTLANVAGPKTRQQRTYLLSKDRRAPQRFGVDELIFTFSDSKAALKFSKTLKTSVAGCGKRLPTAKISDKADITEKGAKSAPISGWAAKVRQSTGQDTKVTFRVASVVSGSQVIYLISNPNDKFDFTQAKWTALAKRAGIRASQ